MEKLISYLEDNRERHLAELGDFLAIPSISTSPAHDADIQTCAKWVSNHLASIGMENVAVHPTRGHPVVYADWLHAPGKPTVLIYGHYDVQPPEPLDLWSSPPFKATVRNGNLYARGAADDKGQVFIHFKSIQAYLKTRGSLPVNIKFLIEGEEEIGSEHLGSFVKEHKDLLKADLVLISDSSMFARGIPSICYGLRGIAYMQVEVTGPNRDLHSGSFGGTIHNPIQVLSEIIAKLHDSRGRVSIPGFYDDVRPLSAYERRSFKRLPWSDRAYARGLGVKQLHGEVGFSTLERVWARPTLECNGIWGGYTGAGAKTVLPSKATAKISMRLVPDQKSDRIGKLFVKHIQKIAPRTVVVNARLIHGGEAAITPLESPGVRAAAAAMEKGFGKKPIYQREGGSIPIVVQFKKLLGLDSVLLGFGLPDENSHAPDEFLNLENFSNGMKTSAHFFNELPHYLSLRRRSA